jgi:transcriptional regulator with XRE-family HTH domain
MTDETEERRRHSVTIIKETAESANNGRSYLLKGLWACRLAAGLDQRQLTEAMGSTQATVGQLERGDRGAYPKTVARLRAIRKETLIRDGGKKVSHFYSIQAWLLAPTYVLIEEPSGPGSGRLTALDDGSVVALFTSTESAREPPSPPS